MYAFEDITYGGVYRDIRSGGGRGEAENMAFYDHFARRGYAVVYDDTDDDAAQRGNNERYTYPRGRSGVRFGAWSGKHGRPQQNELGLIQFTRAQRVTGKFFRKRRKF